MPYIDKYLFENTAPDVRALNAARGAAFDNALPDICPLEASPAILGDAGLQILDDQGRPILGTIRPE